MPDPAELSAPDLARIQRRTVAVLAVAQVLGGVAVGATLSVGVLIAAEIAGESLAGLATAAITFGTALLAIPLATLARRRGRRVSLTTGIVIALAGVLLVFVATGLRSLPLLLFAFALVGAGQATNLQSRFAATDLATDAARGRALSLVVWATTIGVVLGPNLVEPGEALGSALGLPALTGPFVFTVVGQILAVAVYLAFLRPDPLTLAQRLAVRAADAQTTGMLAHPDRPGVARIAIFAVAGAHVVMVSVMAMTPVHLLHHGATLSVIGLTISLHVAGMYALSPLFGIVADRLGRTPTVLLGQVILAAALVTAGLAPDSMPAVTAALVLLGLGWSATTVAASALLTEASSEQNRTRRQGLSDFVMSLVGAVGAVAAGLVLGAIGYAGLALVALAVVAAICLAAPFAFTRAAPAAPAAHPTRR